jgi:serine/threonine-protein kinase
VSDSTHRQERELLAVAGPFQVGDWVCRPSLHRLVGPRGTVQLEPKVLQVLLCLASRPGRVWTRADLLDSVWQGGAVSEQVLSRAISELRKAFADDSRAPRAIETIAKSGYRLLLPVAPVGTAGGDDAVAPAAVAGGRYRALGPPAALAVAIGAVVVAAWIWLQDGGVVEGGRAGPLRASLLLPPEAALVLDEERSFALSPDGAFLVYSATREGAPALYVRRLDRAESEPLIGGEGGYGPFFSSDGNYVGFYAEGSLRRVGVEGGESVTLLVDASDALGATWGDDGTLVFTRRWLEGLWWMRPGEGARRLTELDVAAGERSHHWPELLPGGRHLLYTVWKGGGIESCEVVVLDLENGRRRSLLQAAADARFVPPGFLVFVRSGALAWVELDVERVEVKGPPRPLLEGVRHHPVSGAGHFAISRLGHLVWADWDASTPARALYRVDAKGRWGAPVVLSASISTPQLSPRAERVALTRNERGLQVWLHDLTTGSEERLTGEGESLWPVWSPDGRSIAFSSQRDGVFNLYMKEARGDAPARRLTTAGNIQLPGSFSPDGLRLAYAEFDPKRRWDIWLLGLERGSTPEPFLNSPFDELRPTFSPDGRSIAYVSNESGRWDETGRWEVFIRPLDSRHLRVQASRGGGGDPAWSSDGARLYYRQAERLFSVAVGPDLAVGEPRLELPDLRLAGTPDMMSTYALLAGGGLLAMRLEEPLRSTELHLRMGGLPWDPDPARP